VIPDAQAQQGIQALLEAISDAGSASFLGVLKTLGGDGLGYLSFPMRGMTLALDFPRTKRNAQLLQQLEAITLTHGGRIYLAKDALLSPEGFRIMYPQYREFYHVITKIDPEGRMQSDLARRLALREMQHGY
jgi:decaprenylphospho-beta-D-ribofuranose 2-oxidase